MQKEQKSFQDRVTSINQRAEVAASKAPPARTDSIWVRLSYPGSFIGAFFLGAIAVFLTRYFQSQLVSVPADGQPGAQDIVGIGLASMAGLFVSMLFKGKQKEFASACTLGVLLTTFTYHNAVWAYPEPFEQVYGQDWVEFVQSITKPSSIYFFGNTIELS